MLENRGHQPFDLVFMDVEMPEMDGLTATAMIRQRERTTGQHLLIVAFTAYAMKGDEEVCPAAGMDAYLAKPIQPRDLHEILEQQVAQRRKSFSVSEPQEGKPLIS